MKPLNAQTGRELAKKNQTDQNLPASDDPYRGLFEHMLEGFAYCKMINEAGEPKEFIYLEVNSAFEKLTGLTGVPGKYVSELIPGIRETNPELFEIYGRVASTGNPEKFETYVDALGIWFAISVYSPRPEHFVAVFDNITERKRVEEALRESEQRFNLIYNKIPLASTLSRRNDGTIVDVNEAFERVFGYTREAAVGKTSLELGINPDAEGRARILAELQAGDSAHEVELKLCTKTCGMRIFLVNIDLVDIRGEQYILQTALDITERKRVEEALRIENERFLHFANSNIVGVVIANASGKITLANDYYLDILGVTRQDFLDGKVDWRKFTPPEWLPADEKALQELSERGTCEPYEKEYVRADGTRVPVYIADAMLPGPEGQIAAFVLDITKRKQADWALLESEERIRHLFTISPDAFLLIDPHHPVISWPIVDCNEAACQINGYAREDLIGQSIDILNVAAGTKEERDAYLNRLRHEGVIHIETLHRHKDGHTFPVEVSTSLFTFEGRELIVGIDRDITERKQAEADQLNYTTFLESLNYITRIVLEAQDLKSTLEILVENIAELFGADDCFLALWDEANEKPVPMVAYGSMKDYYHQLVFETGEHTLAASLIKAGRPLIIPDLKNSPYLSPENAALFPSRTMLGLPLIVQDRKLGTLLLGYNESRSFSQNEMSQAEIAAQQIALVLMKIQLFEDTQKRVKQLTVLHEIAEISTQVDTVDRLIESATEIIGKNLFPDNFGILLMDEEASVLRAHPSYRFVSANELAPTEIPLGLGITGQVAQTGQPIRIGKVECLNNYINVDPRTASELCVPIRLKERVLGVINAESIRPEAFTQDDELLLGTLAGQLATAIEQLRAAQAERQWLDQLAHSNELIYAIAHITTHIEKALTQEEIVQTLGRELSKIGLTCCLATFDKKHGLFTINYTSLETEALDRMENSLGFPLVNCAFSLEKLNSILNHADLHHPAVVAHPENEIQVLFPRRRKKGISEILRGVGVRAETELLRLPLVFEENLLGILWVWGQGITKTDLPIMSIFAKQVGSSLERARLFQEVQSLALTDPLTGLQNRRSLFELGRIEFARSKRTKRPFCCMMLDVDHFKQINDNYGHHIGDQVLQEFAQRSKNLVREVDIIGRYGGEELVIFLPETDLDTAVHVAERLRSAIEKTPVRVSDQELCMTISIGVATKDENTGDLQTLIARADQAMYIAKYKGRNQVATSR